MKYIKTYENITENNKKYKIGDYVLLDYDSIIDSIDLKITIKPFCNMGEIVNYDIKDDNYEGFPYTIVFYNGESFEIKEDEILRHLTPSEIKEIEFKKNISKYNL